MRRTRYAVPAAGLTVAAVLALAGCTNSASKQASSAAENGRPAAGSAASSAASKPSSVASTSALVARPRVAVRLAAADMRRRGSAHISGRIAMSIDPSALGAGGSSGQTAAVFRFSGDEQWSPTLRARLTMTGLPGVGASGSGASLTMRLVGTTMYLHVPGLGRAAGKPWVKVDLALLGHRSGVDVEQLFDQARQMDPTASVKALQASGDLRRVGTETVGGVKTAHLAGTVSLRSALRQLRGSLGAQATATFRRLGMKREHIDVWIDAHSQVRREKVSMRGSAFAMAVDMDVSRYGERVAVAAPSDAKTTDLATLYALPKGSSITG